MNVIVANFSPLRNLSIKQLNHKLDECGFEYQACLAGMSNACDAELLGKIDDIREELDYRENGYPTP